MVGVEFSETAGAWSLKQNVCFVQKSIQSSVVLAVDNCSRQDTMSAQSKDQKCKQR